MYFKNFIKKTDVEFLNSKTNYNIRFSPYPQKPDSYKIVFEVRFSWGFYTLKALLFNEDGTFRTYYKFWQFQFARFRLFTDLKKEIVKVITWWERNIL